jgi:hypothetical protein
LKKKQFFYLENATAFFFFGENIETHIEKREETQKIIGG